MLGKVISLGQLENVVKKNMQQFTCLCLFASIYYVIAVSESNGSFISRQEDSCQ